MFLTGVGAYAGYAVFLLPWSTWGHYAYPLGVFFAFSMAVVLADRIERLPARPFIALVAISVLFAMIVGASALKFQATYQYDTANLIKWLATNSLFEHELSLGAVVRGNAQEPCTAVVRRTNVVYGKKYEDFIFTPSVRDILSDVKTRYYLWGPYWGNQDLSRLGQMWTPMFVSEHWVLFRRMQ